MPWVRLHATKDYFDMVAVLDEFPDMRFTVNLVPSLIVQLKDFANGKCSDPWLDRTLLPAAHLTPEDKRWILENFFYCNWDTMIFPNARYGELFERRGRHSSGDALDRISTYFNAQDYLDLQVWFNLAWMDPYWQEKDPFVSAMFKKGRNFTEEEKVQLIDKQREICLKVIDKHKELWHKGQIEVATTPFYHPILPLVCDTDAAQICMPGSLKPKQRYRHPEDARTQIQKALDYMEQTFGKRPLGMWPSEGSVSPEAAGIFHELGLKWIATDEGVLFHSIEHTKDIAAQRGQILYQPYSVNTANHDGGKSREKLQMVFRDHSLSDAIGFIYARMDPQKAVDDFTGHLVKIADSLPESATPPLVSVILDGENCWESYPRDGTEFLKILYRTLSHHPRIQSTTVSDFIAKYPAQKTIQKLWSGSWINSDFAIWIGHPEDNRAWDLLKETRDFLQKETAAKSSDPSHKESLSQAWESLYIAEGSDWCWWYGDQNSTAQDETFDQLYRTHLKNVYHFLGHTPPQKLNVAIKIRQRRAAVTQPLELLTPRIDGLVTNFYEWRAAGSYVTSQAGGTMHQTDNFLSTIIFGFDLENIYIRLDPSKPLKQAPLEQYGLVLQFIEPAGISVHLSWQDSKLKAHFQDKSGQTTELREAAAQKVIELALPFELFPAESNHFEFQVQVLKEGTPIETWPHQTSIGINKPTKDYGSDLWTA